MPSLTSIPPVSYSSRPLLSSYGNVLAQVARNAYGAPTIQGPDGGNLACAWAVNQLMQQAFHHTYGTEPDNVVSVRNAILQAGGRVVPVDKACVADLAVAFNTKALEGIGGGTAHIGVFVQPNLILANSSSRRAFNGVWQPEAFAKLYGFFEVLRPVENEQPCLMQVA
jgi:hypothetical protein